MVTTRYVYFGSKVGNRARLALLGSKSSRAGIAWMLSKVGFARTPRAMLALLGLQISSNFIPTQNFVFSCFKKRKFGTLNLVYSFRFLYPSVLADSKIKYFLRAKLALLGSTKQFQHCSAVKQSYHCSIFTFQAIPTLLEQS